MAKLLKKTNIYVPFSNFFLFKFMQTFPSKLKLYLPTQSTKKINAIKYLNQMLKKEQKNGIIR